MGILDDGTPVDSIIDDDRGTTGDYLAGSHPYQLTFSLGDLGIYNYYGDILIYLNSYFMLIAFAYRWQDVL